MKVVYIRESERAAWLSVNRTRSGNHSPSCIGFSCDVVVIVVEIYRDVSSLVTVKRPECDPTYLVVLPPVLSLHLPHNSLAANDGFTVQNTAYVT